jgi:PhnB protein
MKFQNYLLFGGQCEEAFTFYHKCLGGKIDTMMRHEGSPAAGQVSAEWQKKILHAQLTVGDAILMGSDAPPEHYSKPQGFSVSIQVEDIDESKRIYEALSAGGKIIMPLGKTFWSVQFGMFHDRFGIPWMVNCTKAA